METEEIDEVDDVRVGRRIGIKRKNNKLKPPHIVTAPRKKHVPDPPKITNLQSARAYQSKEKLEQIEDDRDALAKRIADNTDLAIALDDETAHAHNLFLFGPNGRRPVKDLAKLAQMTGVPLRKLEIVAPAWKREALRIAREASPLFAMASTTKARVQHSHDLDKMRVAIDEFEAALPGVSANDYGSKYRQLMLMRKEWQDAAGITSAINISQAMLLMEGKAMLEKASGTKEDPGGEPDDISAFDVDV